LVEVLSWKKRKKNQMTPPQQEGTQTGEESNSQILSSFVHIENVNGPQVILNCGHRSLNEMLALQEQAIRLQRQYQTQGPSTHQPQSGTSTSAPVPPAAPLTYSQVPPTEVLGAQTPAARKNPPRTRKKKDKHDILPTPQDTPEAPVESSSKKTDTQRDPDYQFVETQGLED
jgi:hypothetical protein